MFFNTSLHYCVILQYVCHCHNNGPTCFTGAQKHILYIDIVRTSQCFGFKQHTQTLLWDITAVICLQIASLQTKTQRGSSVEAF